MMIATVELWTPVDLERAGGRWAAWLAFVFGISLSLCANIGSTPDSSILGVTVAACPPLALLLAVELLNRALKRHRTGAVPLVEMQWCEFAEIRDTVEMTAAPHSCHLAKLREDGYVESHGEGRLSQWRLTPLGCERLTDHLNALHAAVTRAGEILASVTPTDPEVTS
jgi:hypothetical protein